MASLVPRPLPDFILQPWRTHFLEGGEIKSGSGLGMRLATNYAPYEEVMKHSATAWKQAFMGKTHQYRRSVRLLCKMCGETVSLDALSVHW